MSTLPLRHMSSCWLTRQSWKDAWVAHETLQLKPRGNRLAYANTLDLKIGGSSRSSLRVAARRHGYNFLTLSFFRVRSLCSTATMYRRLAEDTEMTRYTLCRAIQDGALCYLHWIDNYAKFYRASSLLYNKAIQQNCLWTAHGVKVWPG